MGRIGWCLWGLCTFETTNNNILVAFKHIWASRSSKRSSHQKGSIKSRKWRCVKLLGLCTSHVNECKIHWIFEDAKAHCPMGAALSLCWYMCDRVSTSDEYLALPAIKTRHFETVNESWIHHNHTAFKRLTTRLETQPTTCGPKTCLEPELALTYHESIFLSWCLKKVDICECDLRKNHHYKI